MQPHAHANRDVLWPALRGEGALRLDGGGERVTGAGEGGEEGIPLRIHLLAAVGVERGAHQPAMLGQDVGVVWTYLLQETRGAFDVGEQEGDGAGGEIRHAGAPLPAQAVSSHQ